MAKKPKRKKTELGRTLAKIRIDFDETAADMAGKIGVSPSQMFNIEVGLAQVGYELIGKIKEVYEVDLTEIMKRGGFMSKITLDLDELSQADKDTVLEIWARRWTGEPPDTVTMKKELTITTPADAPAPAPVRHKPKRPPTIPDDIVFLTEEADDNLSDLKPEDVL